jgi:hypothetical protein
MCKSFLPHPNQKVEKFSNIVKGEKGLDIQRLENENKYDYIKRIVYGKLVNKTVSEDYEDLSEKIFGEGNCYNGSEVRKRMYGIKHLLDIIENSPIETITEDAMLKKIELAKQELQKEKYKVQTEKLSLNQLLREEARFELFIEHAVRAIENVKPIEINTYKNKWTKGCREGLLLFADAHYGKELSIKGLYGEILNEYSIEIFEQRMADLLVETVDIVDKEGFDRIKVFNLGDEIEGILRISQLMSLKLGIVDSSIAFAYFIASWLNELSRYVSVDYYSTLGGNHSEIRVLTGKKNDFPNENMGKVIHTLVTQILKDNPNVTIHDNGNDKIFTNIAGYNVLGIHGEEKNIMQAIRDFSFIYNTDVDFLVSGHRHHANSVSAGIKKGCIGVGSIIGIDDFSMQLKRTSDASATFVVFEEGKGKTIEYNICLN